MELTEAVRGRRSVSSLTDPAPTDEEICALIADAAMGPDHGLLRPWRLILIRDAAREALGTAIAADLPADDCAARARAAAKPLRAALLVAIVFSPRDVPKVPSWEQLAATVAMVHNLALLLHGHGWGAMWRTGAPSRSPGVREFHGVGTGEQLLGWLYVGTPAGSAPAFRPEPDVRSRVFALRPDGAVTPLARGAGRQSLA
jgi:nitroreductase